jgi:PAS domain S-box-containing protein
MRLPRWLRRLDTPLPRLEALIRFAAFGLIVIVSLATVAHVQQLRDSALSEADGRLRTLARLLSKELDRTLGAVQSVLEQAEHASPGSTGEDAAQTQRRLESLLQHSPLLREIAIVDARGRVVTSSNPRSIGVRVADYDFAAARLDPIHVGEASAGRSFDREGNARQGTRFARDGFITVTRQSSTRGERLVAVIGSDSLINELRFLAAEDIETLGVYRYDGRVLAASDQSLLERSTANPIFRDFIPEREAGHFSEELPGGGAWRAHFATTPQFPVVVEVRLSQSAVDARWHADLWAPLTIAVLALLGVVFFTRMTARALSERQQSELQVATKERRLRTIIDSAADGIVTIDGNGIVREFNRAAEAVFACTAHQVIGKPFAMLLTGDVSDAHQGYVERYLRTGSSGVVGRSRTIRTRRMDGRPMEISLAISEVIDQGEHFFTGIVRDMTERQRQEEELRVARDKAEEAMRAKADFLAMMSHELRTPMTGIIGMCDLLEESDLSEEQRHLLSVLHNSAHSLLTVLNDVLDFSKIEAGKLTLECIDFQPHDVAREVIDLLAPGASVKGNTLIGDWISDELPMLNGDPTRLRQVLYNLVGNANKFTDHGTVILSIRPIEAASTAASGESSVAHGHLRLRFEVRDTGIGIAPEVLPDLFRPFEQADTSTTRRFGGTGLGLAICRRLVEAMNGTIGVQSTPGAGSTFWFTLELPHAADGARANTSGAPDTQHAIPASQHALHILLAEDNPTNQLLLTTRLRRGGHQVDVVSNGEEAIAAVAQRPYDLVLMDMQMPELDGASATRRIRALNGARAKVPVVALTADALPEFRQRYMDAGLDDYLTKPVDWDRLEQVLARYRPAAGATTATAAGSDLVSDSGSNADSGANTNPGLDEEPAHAPDDDAARLDALQVGRIRADLGDDVFDDVLDLYWPRTATDIEACGRALADARVDDARRCAHSVKGSSSSLGFESVARAAARLADCPADEATAAYDAMRAAFERVRAVYGLELQR